MNINKLIEDVTIKGGEKQLYTNNKGAYFTKCAIVEPLDDEFKKELESIDTVFLEPTAVDNKTTSVSE